MEKKFEYRMRPHLSPFIENEEDLQLIEEAEEYTGFKFAILEEVDVLYMERTFFLLSRGDTTQYTLYFEHKKLEISMIKSGDFYHVISCYIPTPDKYKDLLKESEDLTPRSGDYKWEPSYRWYKAFLEQFTHGNLADFLDPNYGGSFDEAHKEIASLIIFC